jgi:uncharacterized membrane protein (DUF373 family)
MENKTNHLMFSLLKIILMIFGYSFFVYMDVQKFTQILCTINTSIYLVVETMKNTWMIVKIQ